MADLPVAHRCNPISDVAGLCRMHRTHARQEYHVGSCASRHRHHVGPDHQRGVQFAVSWHPDRSPAQCRLRPYRRTQPSFPRRHHGYAGRQVERGHSRLPRNLGHDGAADEPYGRLGGFRLMGSQPHQEP